MHSTDNQGIQYRTSDLDLSLPSPAQESATEPVIPGSRRGADDHEAKGNEPGSPDTDPLTTAPRWALCPLDWHAHAIDAWADHPLGIWIARCGHRLSGGTPLYDVPHGHQCPNCARWSQTTEPKTRTGQ
jgi:hypothetical protein